MRTFAPILATLALTCALIPTASAAEPGIKESVKQSTGAAKDAVVNIVQDGKDIGRGTATAAKETGAAISRGAKNVANDVSTGFRRDFIQGGAIKGPRPDQPKPGLDQVPAQ